MVMPEISEMNRIDMNTLNIAYYRVFCNCFKNTLVIHSNNRGLAGNQQSPAHCGQPIYTSWLYKKVPFNLKIIWLYYIMLL